MTAHSDELLLDNWRTLLDQRPDAERYVSVYYYLVRCYPWDGMNMPAEEATLGRRKSAISFAIRRLGLSAALRAGKIYSSGGHRITYSVREPTW